MSTTVLTEDTATIIANDRARLSWGICAAGAVAAIATSFFLLALGGGVGLSMAARGTSPAVMLSLGAIYFFASQAFGFAVGGYLVGRLIGPEVETTKEEEFRAAAHGFVMWSLAVVAGLLLAASVPTMSASTGAARMGNAGVSNYWVDSMFRGAPNNPVVIADKAQASRILLMTGREPLAGDDRMAIADMVSRDTGLSGANALTRVSNGEIHFRDAVENLRKAAAMVTLWTAFALLFGAIVSVASAISARWMDDKVGFSLARRNN